MKYFNYIFYSLLFVGFFLPTNSSFYLSLPGIFLKVNEIAFLLLPIINIFCFSKNRAKIKDNYLKELILWLIFSVLLTEFLFKIVVFDQSLGDSFKTLRLGLPLFSSLIFLKTGIKADIQLVWTTLLLAIGSSMIISFASIFIEMPIYYVLEEGTDILSITKGRLMNSNASFGLFGLYLLFRDKGKWYNKGRLVKSVSILSVIALVFTFNRTYLAILVLEFLYLSYTTFNKRNFIKILAIPISFFLVGLLAYQSSEVFERQINKRILSIVFNETSLVESTIEGNRDSIYEGIKQRFDEGYWVIGLPYSIGIFEFFRKGDGYRQASKTDISLVNVLLRFGIIPFFIFILLLKRILIKGYVPQIILILFTLASLNIDALFNHNSILFLLLFCLIFTHKNLKDDKGFNDNRNFTYP